MQARGSVVSTFKVSWAVMFGRLGVLNAFLTYDIFNLQCVYQDVTPIFI